jgi:hypothetical protein
MSKKVSKKVSKKAWAVAAAKANAEAGRIGPTTRAVRRLPANGAAKARAASGSGRVVIRRERLINDHVLIRMTSEMKQALVRRIKTNRVSEFLREVIAKALHGEVDERFARSEQKAHPALGRALKRLGEAEPAPCTPVAIEWMGDR